MLRSLDELKGYFLSAADGEIGRCKDFLFDDERWTVRYMVADTGTWLPARKVLISPISLGEPRWKDRTLPVELSKEQIEDSPPLDEDAPVTRQHEANLLRHFDWPFYWGGTSLWGSHPFPTALSADQVTDEDLFERENGDSHLRSVGEVAGYHIGATDGEIGHVEDFIADLDSWTIRYLVIDTRNWLPGRKVIVSPDWVVAVSWETKKVQIDLTRDEIKSCPEYDPSTPVHRRYEARLYDFLGRPVYWE